MSAMSNEMNRGSSEAERKDSLVELIKRFEADHPEILEAMKVFGVSSAEYGRAIRALHGSTVFTSSST